MKKYFNLNNPSKVLTLLFMLWALVIPWSLAAMQIALGLVFIWAVFMIVKSRRFRFHPFFIFLGMYLLTQIFAALFSNQPGNSLVAFVNTEWVVLTIPVLAAATLSVDDRRKITNALLLSFSLVAVYAIFQFFSGIDLIHTEPLSPMGSFYRANGGYNFYLTLAGNELMAFAVVFALLIRAKDLQNSKALYVIAALLIFGGIIATFARSAWIGLVFIIGVGTLVVNRRLFVVAAIGAVVLVVGLAIAVPEIQERIVSIFDLSQNETRLNLWKTSLAMIADNPFFGIGPGCFSEMFPVYKVPGFYDTFTHAHNDHINIAANSGLLGFFAWVTLWVAWFYYAARAFLNPAVAAFDRGILFGAILAITGILIAGFFQCYYTDLENNIFWWFLVAIGLQIIVQTDRKGIE